MIQADLPAYRWCATARLDMAPLTAEDAAFVMELVNTPGWIRFIGDRNVRDMDAAYVYIEGLQRNPDVWYWVVRLRETQTPIGVVTFIQRNYLSHRDLGFAFLPAYHGQGFACEAAAGVLEAVLPAAQPEQVLATTLPDNTPSIYLLERLGFKQVDTIEVAGDTLLLHALLVDRWQIDRLAALFFKAFTNHAPHQPNWESLYHCCLPEVRIVKKTAEEEEIYDLQGFLEPRKRLFDEGTLTDFKEYETEAHTEIVGNIAQRRSQYRKSGVLHGKAFEGGGHKMFQWVRTREGWKISALLWEDGL